MLLVRLVKTADESGVGAHRSCILHISTRFLFKILGFGSLPRRGAAFLQAALVLHILFTMHIPLETAPPMSSAWALPDEALCQMRH